MSTTAPVPIPTQSAPSASSQDDAWRRDMTFAAVLYRIVECGDKIDLVNTELGVGKHGVSLKSVVDEMNKDDVIEIGPNNKWVPTERGKQLLAKLVQMTDITSRFAIFQSVVLEDLSADVVHEDRLGQVAACRFDPRFRKDPNAENFRLAMFDFLNTGLSEKLGGPIDLRSVVFLQHLGSNEFRSAGPSFWSDLRFGVIFDKVERIVRAAYQWRDMCPGNEEEAKARMTGLYEAGMVELRKRGGATCVCGTPLALYEDAAAAENNTLDNCPACNAVLKVEVQTASPPAATGAFTCPNAGCGATINASDRRCRGCGSEVDFSLPTGTVATETVPVTTTTTEVVSGWSYGYDYYGGYYEPYGYFYPYDPFYDALAFTCLAVAFYSW